MSIDDCNTEDLFGHLLDYQETAEFKQALEDRTERKAVERRPKTAQGSRVYRRRHPDLIAARARAEKHRSALYVAQSGLCYICHEAMQDDCEVDHIIPLTKGGTNERSNLCAAHGRCNRLKSNKT